MSGFLVKVIALSVLLSIAIKYAGPLLPVSATTLNALIGVCLPTLLMAMLLSWRWRKGTAEL